MNQDQRKSEAFLILANLLLFAGIPSERLPLVTNLIAEWMILSQAAIMSDDEVYIICQTLCKWMNHIKAERRDLITPMGDAPNDEGASESWVNRIPHRVM